MSPFPSLSCLPSFPLFPLIYVQVAFLFVIDKGLPKVPYFTIADMMMTGAFVILFLAGFFSFPFLFLLFRIKFEYFHYVIIEYLISNIIKLYSKLATENFVVWMLCYDNNPLYLKIDTWSCIAFPVASLLYPFIILF
jgi:hypothetical protein